jgi:transposase
MARVGAFSITLRYKPKLLYYLFFCIKRTMARNVFSGTKWERIKDFLPGKADDCGVTAKDNRRFIEAVLWIARTGSPWRDLPEEFGHWHRVYVRYSRWGKKGTWSQLSSSVSDVPDLEYLMVDGSIVRVHQHGAAKKQPSPCSHGQVVGRAEHQDTRGGRCPWHPRAAVADGAASVRTHPGGSVDRGACRRTRAMIPMRLWKPSSPATPLR